MTNLRQRMSEDLELRGLSANTRRAYLGAVKQLAKYYHKPPDQITEAELRAYLLHLKTEKKVAQSTFTVYLSGLKFFYETTLKRVWPTLELARSRREKKLPVVLSTAEVGRILGCVQKLRYQVCLSTIYACGLRISEGVRLRVEDVDSERMQLYVRNSKGGKDRTVPLPERTPYRAKTSSQVFYSRKTAIFLRSQWVGRMEPSLTLEHKIRWVGSFSSTFSPPFSPSSTSDDYPTRKKIWKSWCCVNNYPSCNANSITRSNPARLRN